MVWQCAHFSFDTHTPIIMGILNVTPDSFSDGGSYVDVDIALAHAHSMLAQGAHIIDVGGESTRPGAAPVEQEEEMARVLPVVRALVQEDVCVSIDTRHVCVARAALDVGAAIINDVSGFRDPAMVEVACNSQAGLVVMHMKGDPATMQQDTAYSDIVNEVRDYLQNRAHELEDAGISHNRICIDPGPGFGKTAQQTIELMRNMHEFVRVGYPVMVACSRKSYIGYAYGKDVPQERDKASATEALMACELGACVVRTHNVAETMHALKDLRPFVLLGLGCNVALVAQEGEEREAKIAQLNHAIGQLCTLPDSQIIDIASFYESEPAYYLEQDSFINTVVLMRCGVPPKELLKYLHAIENSLGRVREQENGPRTCDIDILDYQMYVCESPELTLPHPRLSERDFVVKPLLEIMPYHKLANGVMVGVTPEENRVGRAVRL